MIACERPESPAAGRRLGHQPPPARVDVVVAPGAVVVVDDPGAAPPPVAPPATGRDEVVKIRSCIERASWPAPAADGWVAAPADGWPEAVPVSWRVSTTTMRGKRFSRLMKSSTWK